MLENHQAFPSPTLLVICYKILLEADTWHRRISSQVVLTWGI